MMLRRRRKSKGQLPPVIPGGSVNLLFKDLANPWKDENGHVFTKVGSGPSVDSYGMRNVVASNNYITTPDAPDLRLTGDFTLEIDLTGYYNSGGHKSLFSKGTPTNGTSLVGQFMIHGTGIYVTSDKGSAYYDVLNAVPLPNPIGKITFVRQGNSFYLYNNKVLLATVSVAGKTFGNNASPLNVNGGPLQYSMGLDTPIKSWKLINGEAVFPT